MPPLETLATRSGHRWCDAVGDHIPYVVDGGRRIDGTRRKYYGRTIEEAAAKRDSRERKVSAAVHHATGSR